MNTTPSPAFGAELETQARERFCRDLLAALDREPVETGYVHPAERIIQDAIHRHGSLGAS